MLLVPALAWMQYQWLGQLSTAERERMQRTLRTAAAQFATEFDTELSRTLVGLQLDPQTVRDQNWIAYAQKYSGWVSSSREPRLVRDVWLVDTLPGTELPPLDSTRQCRSIVCASASGTPRAWRSRMPPGRTIWRGCAIH